MPKDWREIEVALVEIARAEGFTLDENTNTGDKKIEIDHDHIHRDGRMEINYYDGPEFNLTRLAKELAERLK